MSMICLSSLGMEFISLTFFHQIRVKFVTCEEMKVVKQKIRKVEKKDSINHHLNSLASANPSHPRKYTLFHTSAMDTYYSVSNIVGFTLWARPATMLRYKPPSVTPIMLALTKFPFPSIRHFFTESIHLFFGLPGG